MNAQEAEKLQLKIKKLRDTVAAAGTWAQTHGAPLCPEAGVVSSYGNGVRAGKQHVLLLSVGKNP